MDYEQPAVLQFGEITNIGHRQIAGGSLADCIRLVIHEADPERRKCATIAFAGQTLRISEIRAIYDRPDFPKIRYESADW